MTEQINQNNSNVARLILHYDSVIRKYTLYEYELEQLKNACKNDNKDVFIACFFGAIPCILNFVAEMQQQQVYHFTLSLNLNLMFGIVGIILGIIFWRSWRISKTNIEEIIKQIKSRPAIEIAKIINVEEIPETKNSVDT